MRSPSVTASDVIEARVRAGAGASGARADDVVGNGVAAPVLTPVFTVTVTLGSPVELGTTPAGRRRLIPITGGTVSGPMLRGTVLPGGGDWQTIDADGTTEIHARYAMQASDGTVVEIDNPGVRVAPPGIIARPTAGENLDSALYYFRTTPRFSLAVGTTHDWLRQHVFVAVGIRHPEAVELAIYQVD